MPVPLRILGRDRPLLLDAPGHLDSLAAGAELLRANTFGLSPRRAPDAPRLAARAVELAREARDASGRADVPVAGVLSPLEHVFRPDLVPPWAELEPAHAEMAKAMAEGGADVLYVDALTTLRETRATLYAAQDTGLPTIAAFLLNEEGNLLGGEPLGDAFSLAGLGRVEACVLTGAPLAHLLLGLESLGFTNMPFGLAPICGRYDGPMDGPFEPCFADVPSPDDFAVELVAALPPNLAVVGAWFGATPTHVAALARALA